MHWKTCSFNFLSDENTCVFAAVGFACGIQSPGIEIKAQLKLKQP